MAHFAKINEETNLVERVIVVNNEDCGNLDFPESEPVGQQFIQSLGLEGIWKQTSYNHNFRNTYASLGFIYYEERDAFVSPPPEPNWILDENFEWQPPE